MTIKWESEDRKNKIEHEVYDFKGSGIALSMYNLDDSIKDFARACMNYGLVRNGLFIFQQNTILKNMMEDLKDIFEKFFKKKFS